MNYGLDIEENNLIILVTTMISSYANNASSEVSAFQKCIVAIFKLLLD